MVLLNNQSARPSGEFWTMSPSSFSIYANDFYAYNRVSISNNVPSPTNQTASVRPAIALKSDVGFSSGNGSKESPYIVKMD